MPSTSTVRTTDLDVDHLGGMLQWATPNECPQVIEYLVYMAARRGHRAVLVVQNIVSVIVILNNRHCCRTARAVSNIRKHTES
jgi:hypothetical protein